MLYLKIGRCFFIVVLFVFRIGSLGAQGGVGDPGAYNAKTFLVSDCFKNSRYKGSFKPDSLKPNTIFRGQRIWRTISLGERQNQEIFVSSNSNCAEVGLFEIIKFGLIEKKLNAFISDNFSEAAKSHLSNSQAISRLKYRDSSVVVTFDANGEATEKANDINRYYMSSDIKSYLLKEDWVMDAHSGKMKKLIVAIAPLVYDPKSEKVVPLFWLYYAEWKELFASFEAKNFYGQWPVTYDEVFMKRYFISQVSKESNVFDRSVKSYTHGDDVEQKNREVSGKLSNSEADMFED